MGKTMLNVVGLVISVCAVLCVSIPPSDAADCKEKCENIKNVSERKKCYTRCSGDVFRPGRNKENLTTKEK